MPIQYSVSEVIQLYNIEFVDIALSIILGITARWNSTRIDLGHPGLLHMWLRRVNQTKNRAEVNMRHLESLCVFYYPNGKDWFAVHSVVSELPKEWREEQPTNAPFQANSGEEKV